MPLKETIELTFRTCRCRLHNIAKILDQPEHISLLIENWREKKLVFVHLLPTCCPVKEANALRAHLQIEQPNTLNQ